MKDNELERLKAYAWSINGSVAHKEWTITPYADEVYTIEMDLDLEKERAFFTVNHKNISKRHEVDFKEAMLYATEGNLFKDLQNPFKEEIVLSHRDDNGNELQITRVLNSKFKSIVLEEGLEEFFLRKLKKSGNAVRETYERIDKADVDKILKQSEPERELSLKKLLQQ